MQDMYEVHPFQGHSSEVLFWLEDSGKSSYPAESYRTITTYMD